MKPVYFRLLLLSVLLIAIAFGFIYREHFDLATLQTWLQQADNSFIAPFIFMLVYALATLLILPASLLTLLGGALFGAWWGAFYTLNGAIIGASFAFLIARYVGAEWIRAKSGEKLKGLIEGVEREGWRFVAFTRLVPFFPFNLLNYTLGLTRIPFQHYVITSYICMFPGTLAYSYLGYVGREAATGSETLIQTVLLALALLAVVMFVPRWYLQWRNRHTPSQ